MKKIFTILFAMFTGFAAVQAQTLVTTQPLNRNAVLEEYTGIHCQYCPQGHAIAAAILAANPGRAAAIAIHQGPYASPNSGEPDYRTSFGDALANQTGLTGYPSGTVNRHVFSGTSTALNRGDWTASCNTIMAMPSCVNLGVESTYDSVTRNLTVHVELYYTGNSAVSSNFINVALIQNHIFGPQSGGNAGNNYEHMDMLRYLITGQWGDEVTTTTQGSLVERTYNYTIPTDYLGVPCMVSNCEIVAFVTEGHQEIITGDVVPAIDGTNLFIGDITATGNYMKLGQPTVTTDFDLTANSNITGSEPFKIKLISGAPADWAATFEINGQSYADSAVVSLEKGTAKPLTVHVIPGFTPSFESFTLQLTSVNKPNAPAKYFKVYVISNVHTLLVNAGGDEQATNHQDVYINGLTAAGCDHLAVMKSDIFVQAKDQGILTPILNIFYNCAWTFPAFTEAEATAVESFINNGGKFFVAGQDIGWDIMSGASGSHGTPVAQDLYTNYLKAAWSDDGSTANNKLVADTSDLIYGTVALSSIVDVYGGNMFPDEINPLQDAVRIFYYNTAKTKTGAIRSLKGTAKVVYFGVGLEMVQNTDVRNDILHRTYDWFMEGVGIGEHAGNTVAHLGQNFPNPANERTTILLSSIGNDMILDVTDLTGRTLVQVPVRTGASQVQVSTSALGSGLYLYRLISNGRVLETKRMEVRR